jgi:glycyl-tRNA synthetase beta chain
MNSTADFLLELGTEELPPLLLPKLRDALKEGMVSGLTDAGLAFGAVQAYAAPRRLGLTVAALQTRQVDREETKLGPAEAAGVQPDGSYSKALQGFARSVNCTPEQLDLVDTPKGKRYGIQHTIAGQETADLLPQLVEQALAKLPIARRMRWGDLSDEFVRPVHWIVLMLGDTVVPFARFGIQAGNTSRGHRFLAPDPFVVNATSYEQTLEHHHVIANFEKRRSMIREDVMAVAHQAGGKALIDEDLLDEVTALCEYPVAVAGKFDSLYLDVPAEAIIAFMQGHQKFFPVVDEQGTLLPSFITVSNIAADDMSMIIAGNERVIRPRLADALFFWQRDKEQQLDDWAAQLQNVVYEQSLGSVWDKTQRIAKLGDWLCGVTQADTGHVARAAAVCRADLLSAMVGEFPDLQGIMGGYYARHAGDHDEVCAAIAEQYLPRFANDNLPDTPTGITLALAERIDTIVGILGTGYKPGGDKDPYALRRAALGVLRIIEEKKLDIDLEALCQTAAGLFEGIADKSSEAVGFIMQRFYGMKTPEQARVFEVVKAVAGGRVIDFNQREQAVLAFMAKPEAADLTQANKRIANILAKVDGAVPSKVDANLLQEPAEQGLYQALQSLTATADYTQTLENLTSMKTAIDAFFDSVMVMVEDAKLRDNRLALLGMVRQQFLQVADISRIQE